VSLSLWGESTTPCGGGATGKAPKPNERHVPQGEPKGRPWESRKANSVSLSMWGERTPLCVGGATGKAPKPNERPVSDRQPSLRLLRTLKPRVCEKPGGSFGSCPTQSDPGLYPFQMRSIEEAG